MNAAINTASWVVGKALAPVADTLLEAWAASAGLGDNVETLTKVLLYVQAMLGRPTTHGRWQDMHNPALELLMQKLRDLAYNAEDVLDELDYFRIQDELDGTSEAADEHAKGCGHNLVLNTRSTAKAVGKMLLCSSTCCSPAAPQARSRREPNTTSSMRKLVSGACNTVRHVGKRLPCSSLPHVPDDDGNNGDHSGMLMTPPPPHVRENAAESPKLVFNRVDISKRMRAIIEQLRPMREEISKILTTLGSSWNNTVPDIAQSRPITTSESIEPRLYGRDDILNSIIHDITQGKYCGENLTVLPIVGLGGIGKTTVAQHIYHNQQVQEHFQVMIWKCVSLNFNVNKLMEDVENLIPRVQDEKYGTAQELIGQRLKSKRFLLVLDDMWEFSDEDEWKRLKLPFQKSQVNGNIIIVTTRSPKLGGMVKTTHHPIDLEGIEREEFKRLFLAFVFGDERPTLDHTVLLETGYKIMDKLKGSPLAAKTVGRLLRNNLDLDHWIQVLESKEWESQRGSNDIMPALKLSYDYLPFDLQQCFSYCALFPQDYKFDSKELILFWIGQDVLHSSDQNNLTVEDIGLRNIRDLVAHGFFKKDETAGRASYTIHDLLHDLALKVTSHECLNVHPSSKTLRKIQPSSIRHLSITLLGYTNDDNYNSELRKLSTMLKVGELKSLMIFGFIDESFTSTIGDLLGEARALRLLCLIVILSSREYVLLQNFSISVHLRYLRLVGIGQNLPSTISRCYHLKILDLQKWYLHDGLPRDMSNLINLGHLLFHPLQDELSSDISNVGKLQFLQELKAFRVQNERNGFELKQLGNLNELRELVICNLEKIHTKEEATEAKLVDKSYLRKLTLVWDKERPNIEPVKEALVLEGLQPHRKLHELCISGHGGPSCPAWLGDHIYEALQYLYLDGIAWEVLPPLERMRSLQELKLEDVLKIEELNLSQIQWLPNLQVVKIINCPKVMRLPPIPWAQTLCHVEVRHAGSMVLDSLEYSKSNYLNVRLNMCGEKDLQCLDEHILGFNNLIDLKNLQIVDCPSLEFKHWQVLTSLKKLVLCSSSITQSGREGEVKWQIPVEELLIKSCDVNGKELTELIYHFPKLQTFKIFDCKKIIRVGVMLEEEDENKLDDGLLIFPAHVCESLSMLSISGCPELSLVPGGVCGVVGGRGGLQALHHLESLYIDGCPKFLSAYKASFSSSCRPFPSSLKYLTLTSVEGTGTLEPLLSNLTSLIDLDIRNCGDDWRSNGLWTLVTQGQLSSLTVKATLKFFVGSDPMRELKDEYQEQLLHSSSILEYLETDDDAILAEPICSILSSSLVQLNLKGNKEVECFTEEQEYALELLTSLEELRIEDCDKLQCLPTALRRLPNLERLSIKSCPALTWSTEFFEVLDMLE